MFFFFHLVVSFEELSKLPRFKSLTATTEEIRSAAETRSFSRLEVVINIEFNKLRSLIPFFMPVESRQGKNRTN